MYRAEFAGVREYVWSTNALTFETEQAGREYALSLLSRWTGADMARVVDCNVQTKLAVDPTDERIVANYRSAQ
jgi:hypothetical protein